MNPSRVNQLTWMHRYPVRWTLGIALALTAVPTIGLWYVLSGSWSAGPWLLSWLASLNATTFTTYGIDKWQAKRNGWRIPEMTLLILAFLGGTIGAFAAMAIFRHKTIKGPFRVAFWLLVAVQLVLVFVLVRTIWF